MGEAPPVEIATCSPPRRSVEGRAKSPSEGDFALPSTLRRGRLQVAVSTDGASPTLARGIKGELEELFGPEWAGVVERLHAARLRGAPAGEELEGEVSGCLSRLRG